MKKCRKCLEDKSNEFFYIVQASKDGLSARCKECMRAYNRLRKNTPEYRKKRRENYIENREIIREYNRKYSKTQKRRISTFQYRKIKLKTSEQYKLERKIRAKTRAVVARKYGRFNYKLKYFGCSTAELKYYIEKKFKEGMSWENRGKWHIDHIRPLCSFNLSDENEFLKACYYTNLQPLWAEENFEKGRKF